MDASRPLVQPWIPRRWHTTVACLTALLFWAPALLLSWSAWRSAAGHWRGVRNVPVGLQAADEQLWLQDAAVMAGLTAAATIAVALVLRRDRGRGTLLAWALTITGMLCWLIGPVDEGSADMRWITCENPHARNESEGFVDLRGWSWTRFADVAVRPTGHGWEEIRC